MNTDKIDKLIREKIEAMDGAPENDQFDRGKSWKRMEHSLMRVQRHQAGWWKLVAAILILFGAAFWVYHFTSSRRNFTTRDNNTKKLVESGIKKRLLKIKIQEKDKAEGKDDR